MSQTSDLYKLLMELDGLSDKSAILEVARKAAAEILRLEALVMKKTGEIEALEKALAAVS